MKNDPERAPPSTAILGGGITGLAAGWELLKRNSEASFQIFEAAPRFGGKIITRRMEGCLLEGGPDSLLTEKPWALDLCRELGLEDELLPSNDHQRSFSILHKGTLHPFPAGCKLFIPQKTLPILTTPLLSLPGKLRMLMEPFLRHRPPEGDESLAEFTRRHFGQETLDRLAGPLLGGIYGGDPETMSMEATFPRLRELERKHGSLVKGMAGMMRQAKSQLKQGQAPSLFTSLRSGMEKLPETLTEKLAGHLRPDHTVQIIEKDGDGWRVDGERFDELIVALPARQAAPLFAELDPELSQRLNRQTSSNSATLSMVFKRGDVSPLPSGFGFMAAHPLTGLLVGCTWTGNKFEGREAEDRFVCRAFLGGPHAADLIRDRNESALIDQGLAALRDICPFIPETPLATWLQPWPDGNPGYTLGHLEWVEDLRRRAEALGGLHFIGSSFEGISVSDCARQAKTLSKSHFV
ncbi:MAG: protoporphyrinogen oxidase [Verrucomicrobia bacterium]|nr:protoporphyrinogen oxidase [Verrucomicrobiota bacterium]MCH8510574.1 protoporphyrinogen oxidase [Kiritimatiellia bacterium]